MQSVSISQRARELPLLPICKVFSYYFPFLAARNRTIVNKSWILQLLFYFFVRFMQFQILMVSFAKSSICSSASSWINSSWFASNDSALAQYDCEMFCRFSHWTKQAVSDVASSARLRDWTNRKKNSISFTLDVVKEKKRELNESITLRHYHLISVHKTCRIYMQSRAMFDTHSMKHLIEMQMKITKLNSSKVFYERLSLRMRGAVLWCHRHKREVTRFRIVSCLRLSY